jgi:hypothetical protein
MHAALELHGMHGALLYSHRPLLPLPPPPQNMPPPATRQPRTRTLRPDFKLKLKCNSPHMAMVKNMLYSTSPSRRLRPRQLVFIERETGKQITVAAQPPGPDIPMQILGQGQANSWDEEEQE